MKNTEILSFEDEWMKLKNITLSEFSPSSEAKATSFRGPLQVQEILYM
jgi:hypothetical protein